MNLEPLDILYSIRKDAKFLLHTAALDQLEVQRCAARIKKNCDWMISNLDTIILEYLEEIKIDGHHN